MKLWLQAVCLIVTAAVLGSPSLGLPADEPAVPSKSEDGGRLGKLERRVAELEGLLAKAEQRIEILSKGQLALAKYDFVIAQKGHDVAPVSGVDLVKIEQGPTFQVAPPKEFGNGVVACWLTLAANSDTGAVPTAGLVAAAPRYFGVAPYNKQILFSGNRLDKPTYFTAIVAYRP